MEERPAGMKQAGKFLIGGGSAAAADFAVYQLLVLLGAGITGSKAVSYASGAAVGFVINKLWTFESRGFSKREILKYIVLYAVSACVNTAVNKFVLFAAGINMLAFFCAAASSTVLNFMGQKFFVFAGKEQGK